MSFFFKAKKNQDRALASRDGAPPGSANSLQGAPSARGSARDDKSSLQRSTPTGSLTSLDIEGSAGSPDQGYIRRGPSVDQPQQASDLPVSFTNYHDVMRGCHQG